MKLNTKIIAGVSAVAALIAYGTLSESAQEAKLKRQAEALGLKYESNWGISVDVAQDELGDKWPFPRAQMATVYCKWTDYGRPRVVIELDRNGFVYGMNGPAVGKEGMADYRSQLARNEWGDYVSGASQELLDRGLKACGPKPR